MLSLPAFLRLPRRLSPAGKPRPVRRQRRRLVLQKLAMGDDLLYLGASCRLGVTHLPALPQGCTLADARLVVNLPVRLPAATQLEEIRTELRLWYRRQARAYIAARLDHWAAILGVAYNRCLITGPISLWGSCNAANDIRINWRIMMAPEPLIDYLLAHELCHVVHKNHSKQFWDLLASVIPDCRQRRQALRALGPRLFAQQG